MMSSKILCLVYLLTFPATLQANSISLDDLYNYQVDTSQRRADVLEKMGSDFSNKAKLVESRCNANIKLSYETKIQFSNKFFTSLESIYITRFRRGVGYCEVHIAYSSGVCITRAQDIFENAVSLGSNINCRN
ncbi:hypothetical protein N8142_01115 [bacterium]|jgi:hypothetical protein|nr:hypothetical protein [bacterium]